MIVSTFYASPIGPLLLAGDEAHLLGLWMEGQKYFGATLPEAPARRDDTPLLLQERAWLDRYFAGERPAVSELSLAPIGGAFRQEV